MPSTTPDRTPLWRLPSPVPGDPPDVPGDIKALATTVDPLLSRVVWKGTANPDNLVRSAGTAITWNTHTDDGSGAVTHAATILTVTPGLYLALLQTSITSVDLPLHAYAQITLGGVTLGADQIDSHTPGQVCRLHMTSIVAVTAAAQLATSIVVESGKWQFNYPMTLWMVRLGGIPAFPLVA